MYAVFKRDFTAYFISPIGYIYLSAYIFILNLYFYLVNISGSSSSLSGMFSFMLIVMIFLTPILTMRVFSEDYKQKTDQLLLTAPVKLSSVVLGKFLSSFAVFAGLLILTLLWPLMISLFGNVNTAEAIGNYIGILCIGAAYISIGIFISSLTENQVIAAVGSICFFIALFVLEVLALFIYSSGILPVFFLRILLFISIISRYNEITIGLLALDSIIFFLSVCAVFLFLTIRVLEKRKTNRFINKHHFTFNRLSLVYTALFLAAVILLNIFVSMFTARFFIKADLTGTGIYSIPEEAAGFLNGIGEPVDIIVLSEESIWLSDPSYTRIVNILHRYSAASNGLLKVQYVNPDLNSFNGPDHGNSLAELKAAHSELDDMARNDILLVSSRRAARIPASNLFVQGRDALNRPVLIARADQELIGALLYILNEKIATVRFINNHQEEPSVFLEYIFQRNGYISSPINPALEDIPEDTNLVITAAPLTDFLDSEILKLERYLTLGGNLMVLLAFDTGPLPRLEAFLSEWGVSAEHKLIFDKDYTYFPEFGVIGTKVVAGALSSTTASEAYTTGGYHVGAFLARPLRSEWSSGTMGNFTLYPLIQTFSASSYAKDLGGGNVTTWERESGDEPGPFVLAFNVRYLTKNSGGDQVYANLIVAGADMFSDNFFGTFGEYFYNTGFISGLAGDFNISGESIHIPFKPVNDNIMPVSSAGARMAFYLTVIALPLLISAAGIIIWLKRRNQ